jgi:DNA-binding NtrC family response regulator
MLSILVATTDKDAISAISKGFGPKGRVETASDRAGLEAAFGRRGHEFLFIDLDMLRGVDQDGNRNYRNDLTCFWKAAPGSRIVVMSSADRIRQAVEAVQAGADNYLTYPLDQLEVEYVIDSATKKDKVEWELRHLRGQIGTGSSLVSDSRNAGMRQALERMRTVAPTRTTVLITGETGTGKSAYARFIHDCSARSNKPYIAVHCGAIPETLLESELFGHEKGAFTGAVKRKLGKFEIAHGGTIFLDEIGTVPPLAQIKLLQAVQERTFQRVGGDQAIAADVRIIAATNADLQEMVESRQFRTDLYYRLNVFPIEVPPLRERKEDIPLLVETFLDRLNKEYGKGLHGAHPAVLQAFAGYAWPGNVRELENLVERAYILETSRLLTPESFPANLFASDAPTATIPMNISLSLAEFRDAAKENAERQYLKEMLAQCRGRINRTAERAGVTTRQLHKLLTKYAIHKDEFK